MTALAERAPAVDVAVQNVVKRFGEVAAVAGVSLEVRRGEFVTLLGPSGCGKTTLLRIIAGLEQATSGEVLIQERPVTGVPPYRRPVSMVFQNLALFPHMNVFENVAFGLEMAGADRATIRQRVAEYLELVSLGGYQERRVSQLSGGQQQRVALARALIRTPAVLLLDEPLAALDLKLRRQMQVELKSIQHRLGTTFIFVTHDQDEALVMSDRIAVMNRGNVEQYGTTEEVYRSPGTSFVATFIGDTNLLGGNVETVAGDRLWVDAGFRCSARRPPGLSLAPGQAVRVSVRPEHVTLHPTGWSGPADNQVSGRVVERLFKGSTLRYVVVDGNQRQYICDVVPKGGTQVFAAGDPVTAVWHSSDAVVVR